MNDKVTTPVRPSLKDDGVRQSPPQVRRSHDTARTRKKAFDLILLDALRGSRPYVESYRAGRGAE